MDGPAEWHLEQIYARHRQGLFTLALSVTGCRAGAEDAVHDAFVRLCRGGLPAARDPTAYVFAAVRNAALDYARRSARPGGGAAGGALGAESIFDLVPAGEPADAGAVADECRRAVADAVDALPAEQRTAVVLRVYAGLSFAQMGKAIGVPLQTAATRYRRAVERLRQQLGKLV